MLRATFWDSKMLIPTLYKLQEWLQMKRKRSSPLENVVFSLPVRVLW